MTICAKCKNHHVVYWGNTGHDDCCWAHPTEPRIDLITGKDTRMFFDYHKKCQDINDGRCPDYEEKEIELEPEKKSWFKKLKCRLRGEINA